LDREHRTTHLPQWKKDEVETIKKLISSHRAVGIAGIHGIPSVQFQEMRQSLRGKALIKVSRNTLIKRALQEANLDGMKDFVEAETALVFTDENPFKLYRILEAGRTPAPIKAGVVAPCDIVVEKGDTSFPPGPIVGELQAAGIPAAIQQGKVVIRETKVVAKEGEVVSPGLATMLSRLGIHPIELGLELRAVQEDGILFRAEELKIDEDAVAADITRAFQQAFNLSVNTAYPTSQTITAILAKGVTEARNLAINAAIHTPEVMPELLAQAYSHMLSLAQAIQDPEALGEKLLNLRAETPKTVEKEEKAEEKEEGGEKEEKEGERGEEEEDKGAQEEEAAAGLGALFG